MIQYIYIYYNIIKKKKEMKNEGIKESRQTGII